MNALDTQIGGSHYQMPIQPMEFAMTQMYDFATASILKYVSRHRNKNGRQDIEKALHIVELRREITVKHDLRPLLDAVRALRRVSGLTWVGSVSNTSGDDMGVYIEVNGFTGHDAKALRALDDLHRQAALVTSPWYNLRRSLNDLLDEYDGGPKARLLAEQESCDHCWDSFPGEDGIVRRVCPKCGLSS